MQNNIFRKESMDRLKSPEQLNEYIRVARPSVWILLAAAIFVLVGMLVWSILGRVETVVRAGALSENGAVVCYVDEEDAATLQPGMPVTVQDITGTIQAVSDEPVPVDGLQPYLTQAAGLTAGSFCYAAEVEIDGLPDGVYFADITVERIQPIRFVFR